MARTIEFGESPDDRRIIEEDGTSHLAPQALESTELVEVAPLPVSKTQARAAANLRFAGASYADIARILDYKDPATARRVVEEALARTYPDESRETLHKIASGRLQQLMFKLSERTEAFVQMRDDHGNVIRDGAGKAVLELNPEQLAYVKTVADLNSRWVRLHGLEAPQQVQITPDAAAFDAVVSRAREQMLAGQAPEADVFAIEDAELVDDEVEEGELDG